jgi:CBS domain-containing protein
VSTDFTESPGLLDLKATSAAGLMIGDVVSVPEDAPLSRAATVLIDRGFSGAPVVNEAGRPVGVISLHDMVAHDRNRAASHRLVPQYYFRSVMGARPADTPPELPPATAEHTRVREVTTPVIFAVRPDTPARQVVEEMLDLRIHRLFVTDPGGALVGVIAASDILRHLLD